MGALTEAEDFEVNKNIFSSIVNKPQKIYDIYLYHPLNNPLSLIPYIEILRSAKESDIIKLHIDSTEGTFDAFLVLYNHILLCEGTVVAYVTRASSYGALLALACGVVQFLPYANLELSLNNLNKGIGFGKEENDKLLMDIVDGLCTRILNPMEMLYFKDGQTYTFNTQEAEKRLNKHKRKHKHDKTGKK